MEKLIVFDLDGTLAAASSALDAEKAAPLSELLGVAKVAVVSGGNGPHFQRQLLLRLSKDKRGTDVYPQSSSGALASTSTMMGMGPHTKMMSRISIFIDQFETF